MMSPFLVAVALSCPNLSGTFECPAYGTQQPASHMTVTQSETAAGVTTYAYAFDIYPGDPSLSSANTAGMMDQGSLKFCNGDKLFIGEVSGPSSGTVQYHYLNANGDYVVVRADHEVMHCVKSLTP
jgi:hypothetical protein